MKIDRLELKNFRGYKDLSVEFDPGFNLIIGDNGSGKTALLEALTVAMGSFLLGIKNANSRGILPDDIHIATFETNEEFQFPVQVAAEGVVNGNAIKWLRELNGSKNRTTTIKSESIKQQAHLLDEQIRTGKTNNLPLLAYYATGRLFDVAGGSETNSGEKELASRFRAYNRCLEAKSTYKYFLKWFRGKELSGIQKNSLDIAFETVKQAIISNIPNCKTLYNEFDPDKSKGLKVQLTDGRILPFTSLSDGTRNFFAIVADMAYKCVTLNPHLKEKALQDTSGIVLIDELDLHLHPEWQRKIIHSLKITFPSIQFIVSSHSPFLIQETGHNQLIVLNNSKVEKKGSGISLSIEDIAEEIQNVVNPQWSKYRQIMFEKAREYYKAVKEGTATPDMKNELDIVMKLFSQNTAYHAILEQERIIAELKKKNK
jgi:predicted ATP-binding protein involved in virulence